MNMTQTRPILTLGIIAALSASTAFLAVHQGSLRQTNQALTAKTKELQQSLDTVDERHKALMSSIEKERNNLKEAVEAIKKDQESLKFALQKAEAETTSANEEKSYLEDILIHKTKEIEELRSGGSITSANTVGARSEKTSESLSQKDAEIHRLSEQNKILLEKLEKFYQTTNDKIAEINVAKISLDETISTARKKIDEEWNTVNLGSIRVDKDGSAGKNQERRDAKNQGHVLAVNEENGFVVVDLGKADNIGPDTKLAVTKNGKTIATLTLLEARDAMSAYNVQKLQEGQKIQVNDLVSIQR